MKTRNIQLMLFLTTVLFACHSREHATTKLLDKYEIIEKIKSETTGKAQLLEYAIYKDSVFRKEPT